MKWINIKPWIGYLLPAVILFFGVLLRAYPTLTIPFWEDELHTYNFSTNSVSYIEQILRPQDDRPPLFYIYSKALVQIGTSEVFLRFPGFLAACMSLIVMFALLQKINKKAALTVLFLLSFSLFLIDQSWSFRDYGFLMLISAISLIHMYRIIQSINEGNKLNTRELIRFGVFACIGTMVNYIYLPFILSCASIILIVSEVVSYKDKKIIFWHIITSVTPACVFAGLYLIRQTAIIQTTTYFIPNPSFTSFVALVGYTYGVISDFRNYPVRNFIVEQQYFYIAVGILSSILIAFRALWSKRKNTLYVFSVANFGVFILYVIFIELIGFFLNRSLFLPKAFTPAIFTAIVSVGILISLCIDEIVQNKFQTIIYVLFAYIYMCIFLSIYTDFFKIGNFNGELPNKNADVFLTVIDTFVKPDDQIVFVPTYYTTLYYKYFWRGKRSESQFILSQYLESAEIKSANPQLPQHARIFFIEHPQLYDPEYKMYDATFVSDTKKIYTRAQQLCTSTPVFIFANDLFIIRMCKFK